MRIDLYTKTILTLIFVMLTLIACKSVVQPLGVAADGPFAGVQFSGQINGFWTFDTKTGDVWAYEAIQGGLMGNWHHVGKISQIGQPLTR
jgi:hypothetical protein